MSEATEPPEFCPVHGDPVDILNAWPCPVAMEDDPPDAETCPHFVAMLERSMAEVAVGHFWRLERTETGWISHEYRDHQPTGATHVMGPDDTE